MSVKESLRAGRLDACLAEAQDEVRKNPAQAEPRILLFQLQAVLGQWEKAMSQLNVLADLGPGTLALVQTYRQALLCAALRTEVFAGKVSPLVFGEPEPWMAGLLSALQLGARGKDGEAEAVRAEALAAAPATAGTINGKPFQWLADADSRLGPVLEAIVNGRYYWLPVHRLTAVRVEKPVDLRDLVWLPAYLTLESGSELPALIPSRYPGSETSADPAIALGRKTEWSARGETTFVGSGQRVLATDGDDVPLFELRSIEFFPDPAGP